MSKKPNISIIIPAYNAEKYIDNVIERVVKVLITIGGNYEVICVADGCRDNTQKLAEKEAEKYGGKVKVLGYKKNQGKGFAVRYGMKIAKGEAVGFIDADNEIDPVSIINLLKILQEKKADIVVGSKRDFRSNIKYPFHRRIISDAYYLLVKLLFSLPVSDTQAGIKMFSCDVVKKVLPKLEINGFSFDIEMLVVAKNMGFSKIYEGPIIVDSTKSSDSSTLKSFGVLKESLKMFIDTLNLYFKLRVLK